MPWLRILLRILGVLTSALGLCGSLFAVLALLDPAGTQLANDHDPFGTPPSTGEVSASLAVWLALLGIGLWLSFPRRRGKRRQQQARTNSIQE